MRNILLTTTALATLFAGVAAAAHEATIKDSEGLSVSFGGSLEGQAATRSQASKYTNDQGITPANKNVAFDTIAAIHASVKNKTAEGTTYGAQVGILTTTQSQQPAGSSALDRTFLFIENDDAGRFEFGSNNGVASTMRTGADSIARATGGIDGDWGNYVAVGNLPNYTQNFITAPTTYLTNYQNSGVQLFNGDEKSRKVNYYTPEYKGFQAGFTYTPDVRNSGQDDISALNGNGTPASGYNLPTAKNAFSAGLSWKGEFDKNQSLKVSAVGETSSVRAKAGDPNTYYGNKSGIFGAEYAYEDFSVAASYGNQGKSGFAKNITTGTAVKGGSFWSLGAAYVQGPVGASLTYMNSTLNTNKLNLVSLGLDYQVAPGLLPYFEVTYFAAKQKLNYNASSGTPAVAGLATNSSASIKNKGTAFILGAKLKF